MHVIVIGGTGHIGSYLIPTLIREGHRVTVVARHDRPQHTRAELYWPGVNWVLADRAAQEASGQWPETLARLEGDAVIDVISLTPQQNRAMVEAFAGRIGHFIHIGSIWAYGTPERSPYEEHFVRRPRQLYGRNKVAIENDLHRAWRFDGFPATVIHPGHICGQRWLPIDPQGTRNGTDIYRRLATGQEVLLPGDGSATLHHVHSQDIADLICRVLQQPSASLGESFSAVSPHAMSLAGCCRAVAGMFGREPNLRFVSDQELIDHLGEKAASVSLDHAAHSPCASNAKVNRLLGHHPRFTTEAIYAQCIEHLLETGVKLS